jgi:Flp pilus assembly pilin Flp
MEDGRVSPIVGLWADEQGAVTTETALMLVAVCLATYLAYTTLGRKVSSIVEDSTGEAFGQ